MASPIQIVLNPENFEFAREAGGGGPRTDFFAHRDKQFAEHKARLTSQLAGIQDTLKAQSFSDVGYLKITLRKRAWAKSHRPMKALFRHERTPLIGGLGLGVMLVEAQPAALNEVSAAISKAEPETRMKYIEKEDREVPNPSAQRSEAGAIEKIELYNPTDKRSFSAEQAVAWLKNPLTGGAYHVELFKDYPLRADIDAYGNSHRELFLSFENGLQKFGGGISAQRQLTREAAQPVISVRLGRSENLPALRLTGTQIATVRRAMDPFDSDVERHARLLNFLENHPLVRQILLPGVVVKSVTSEGRSRPINIQLPVRNIQQSYPKLGIIDGGISNVLSDWVRERWGLLAPDDCDLAHGTFIGGLSVAGSSLNGRTICPERDGVDLVDLAVYPDDQDPKTFNTYYPGGLPHFFDEVETAVADVRAKHGVRIFNMSLNVLQPAGPDQYSNHAARLDRIAELNDAIIFVSAGNIEGADGRPEWPTDNTQALSNLAIARNDGVYQPAESARNVSVGAINPPDHVGAIGYAPSRFSRRGPGMRAGAKPDLAHIGGCGTPHSINGHGLFSIAPDGSIVDGCGTSYATPLVARTAAELDHAIEGDVSRETLIGLLVHRAEVPEPLRHKDFSAVARHLVGFGVPPAADTILQSEDNEITLVFASRIRQDQQVAFRFNWPQSLVDPSGKCRGAARLTLVASPPLDPRFGSEFVRVNVEASLQQLQPNGSWKGRLDALYLPGRAEKPSFESELIEHGLKWSPVKVHAKNMPRGVGKSSTWRLSVNYLTRAGEIMPPDGVPFTALLTISDPTGEHPVFNELRQNLTAVGVKISDIRTAARVTPRV
ncbi:S8 family peptidase [Ferrovibrio sp.]|uniref:S8 family peptidase n=1 Tax=Ferrovibrio sp. TaxID=1917215 RepID=UPI0035B46579